MSTDLEKREVGAVLNPRTGEMIELADASTEQIAQVIDLIREEEAKFKAWKKLAGDELLARMDLDGKWTHSVGAYKIKGDSPAPTREADTEPLWGELQSLVSEGKISAEARDRAMQTVVERKENWNGINALLKLGGEVKDRINKHIREIPKQRGMPSVQMVRPK